MRKGQITKKILEILEDVTLESLDLFVAILNAGYGASVSKIEREKEKINNSPATDDFNKRQKQKFNKMVHHLKSQGFIYKDKKGFFHITSKGKLKLKEIQKRDTVLPSINYSIAKDKNLVLVAFDIPEIHRLKRNWLRDALTHMDFEGIQKSVYIGKGKLPNNFLEDLYRLGIFDYIEIIEINKEGTLERKNL